MYSSFMLNESRTYEQKNSTAVLQGNILYIYLPKAFGEKKNSPQMVANQEMLRPQWYQLKKLVRKLITKSEQGST